MPQLPEMEKKQTEAKNAGQPLQELVENAVKAAVPIAIPIAQSLSPFGFALNFLGLRQKAEVQKKNEEAIKAGAVKTGIAQPEATTKTEGDAKTKEIAAKFKAAVETMDVTLPGQAKQATEKGEKNVGEVKGAAEKGQFDVAEQLKKAQQTVKKLVEELSSTTDWALQIDIAVRIFSSVMVATGAVLRAMGIFATSAPAPAPGTPEEKEKQEKDAKGNILLPSAKKAEMDKIEKEVLEDDMTRRIDLVQNPRASADRVERTINAQIKERQELFNQDEKLDKELRSTDRNTDAGRNRRREIREEQNKIDVRIQQINAGIANPEQRVKTLRAEQQRRNDLITRNMSRPPQLVAALDGDRLDATYAAGVNLENMASMQLFQKGINALAASIGVSTLRVTVRGGTLRIDGTPPLFFTEEITSSIGTLLRQMVETPKQHMEKIDAEIRGLRDASQKAVEAFNKSAGQPNDARIKLGRAAESVARDMYNRAEEIAGDETLPVTFRDGAFNAREEAAKTLKTIREQIAKLEAGEKGTEAPANLEGFNKERARLLQITDAQLKGLRAVQTNANYEVYVSHHDREASYLRGAASVLAGNPDATVKKTMADVNARQEQLVKMRAVADKIGANIPRPLQPPNAPSPGPGSNPPDTPPPGPGSTPPSPEPGPAIPERFQKALDAFNRERDVNLRMSNKMMEAFRKDPRNDFLYKQVTDQLAREEANIRTTFDVVRDMTNPPVNPNIAKQVTSTIVEGEARLKQITQMRREIAELREDPAAKKKAAEDAAAVKKLMEDKISAAKKLENDAAVKKLMSDKVAAAKKIEEARTKKTEADVVAKKLESDAAIKKLMDQKIAKAKELEDARLKKLAGDPTEQFVKTTNEATTKAETGPPQAQVKNLQYGDRAPDVNVKLQHELKGKVTAGDAKGKFDKVEAAKAAEQPVPLEIQSQIDTYNTRTRRLGNILSCQTLTNGMYRIKIQPSTIIDQSEFNVALQTINDGKVPELVVGGARTLDLTPMQIANLVRTYRNIPNTSR